MNAQQKTPRVYSKRKGSTPTPAGAVYVGRPSAFGNPFELGRDGTRAQVIARYEQWLLEPAQAALLARVKTELAGRDLECWCAPLRCHADVLVRLANK